MHRSPSTSIVLCCLFDFIWRQFSEIIQLYSVERNHIISVSGSLLTWVCCELTCDLLIKRIKNNIASDHYALHARTKAKRNVSSFVLNVPLFDFQLHLLLLGFFDFLQVYSFHLGQTSNYCTHYQTTKLEFHTLMMDCVKMDHWRNWAACNMHSLFCSMTMKWDVKSNLNWYSSKLKLTHILSSNNKRNELFCHWAIKRRHFLPKKIEIICMQWLKIQFSVNFFSQFFVKISSNFQSSSHKIIYFDRIDFIRSVQIILKTYRIDR